MKPLCLVRLIFPFSCHVRNTCKACFIHIMNVKSLRWYFIHDSTLLAANTLIGIHLNYCISLFRSMSVLDLHTLQSVQDNIAKTTKFLHITPIRKTLHWFLSNIALFSRFLYWCTRSSKMVILINNGHFP